MDIGLAIAIVSGCAVIITAIIKFVPQKNAKKNCMIPTVCLEHSGILAQLEAGNANFDSINRRLEGIEKDNKDMQKMVTEIHSIVMKR